MTARNRVGVGGTCLVVLLAACAWFGMTAPGHAQGKNGMSPSRLQLPGGPGSLEGVGQNVSIVYHMGQAGYGVGITVPAGRDGAQPGLGLSYQSGGGNSVVGLGWSFGAPTIERMTRYGTPTYGADDTFSAGGELVRVSSDGADGVYRSRFEGGFSRYTWHDVGTGGYWTVESAMGAISYYGADATGHLRANARVMGSSGVFRYHLVETVMPLGARVRYRYRRSGGYSLLSRVEYAFQANAEGDRTNPLHRVDLIYEDRPDALSDAKSGVELRLDQRLRRVAVFTRNQQVRYYDLTYESPNGLSQLVRVSKYGRNGSRAHPIQQQMQYSSGAFEPRMVIMGGNVGQGFLRGKADVLDINGDGLPDVLDTTGGIHTFYINQIDSDAAQDSAEDHLFVAQPSALVENGGPQMDNRLVQPVDIDGDGYTDLLDYGNNVLYRNRGLGDWAGAEPIDGANLPNFANADDNLRFFDWDNDKFIDVIYAGGEAGSWVHVNTAAEDGSRRFAADTELMNGLGQVSFVDGGVQMADMNGDGLADIVTDRGEEQVSYRMNLGRGRWSAEIEMANRPEELNGLVQFVDLNGDSLTDLVGISGIEVRYALNQNGKAFGELTTLARGDDLDLDIPEYLPNEVTVRFADMNGSGSTDIVWISNQGQVRYLDLFAERPNLLVRMENGIGRIMTTRYGSSVRHAAAAREAGEPWARGLQQPMLTAEENRTWNTHDGVVRRELLRYADPHYDGVERAFRGYGRVVVTNPEGPNTEAQIDDITFDVGVDDPYHHGKEVQVETYSGERLIYRETQVYDDCDVAGIPEDPGALAKPIRFICQTQTETKVFEGLADAESVTTRFRSEYDGYGNVIRQINDGVVARGARQTGGCQPCAGRSRGIFGAPCDGANETCIGDEEYTETDYVPLAAANGRWIVSAPCSVRSYGVPGTDAYQETRTYYDGDAFLGLPHCQLAVGNTTRVSIRTDEGDFVDLERSRFDAYGNAVESLDALGYAQTYRYGDWGLHTVEESVTIAYGDEDPYTLTMAVALDPVTHQVTTSSGWVRYVDGAPVSLSVSEHYEYDEFGRQIAKRLAGDQTNLPNETYEYGFGSPRTRFITRARSTNSGEYDLETVTCYDGQAKPIQVLTRIGHGHYIADGYREYNQNGAVFRLYPPYPKPDGSCDAGPPDGLVHSESFYDGLGRVTDSVRADSAQYVTSSIARTAFRPYETHVWDFEDTDDASEHRDTPIVSFENGLEERYRVDLVLGANEHIETRYEYDQHGRLTTSYDDDGNRKVQRYNWQGQVFHLEDPDTGITTWQFDDLGQMTHETSDGTTKRLTYDSYGRMRTAYIDGDEQATRIDYTYDHVADCRVDDCRYLAGQLARIEYVSKGLRGPMLASDDFGYDVRGHKAHLSRRFDGQQFDFRAEFDAANRQTATTLPDGRRLIYGFDAASRMTTMPGHVDEFSYTPKGQLERIVFSDGAVRDYIYDALGRLDTLAVYLPDGERALDYRLQYDRVGNIVGVVDGRDASYPSGDAAYTYDALYNLVEAELDRGTAHEETITATYDRTHRITSKRSSLGPSSPAHVGAYTYGADGAGPQMLTSTNDEAEGITRYTYDEWGQMVTRGNFEQLWDDRGRLVSVQRGGGQISQMAYGPDPNRIFQRSGSEVAWHPAPFFEVRNGNAVFYSYVGGERVARFESAENTGRWLSDVAPGQVRAGQFISDEDGVITAGDALISYSIEQEWLSSEAQPDPAEVLLKASAKRLALGSTTVREALHNDHLGSLRLTVQGGAVQRLEHYPYGALRSRTGGLDADYSYIGLEQDPETGLVYAQERYFDPKLGRWLSADSLYETLGTASSSVTDLNGMQRYGYGRNNPTTYRDRDGRVAVGLMLAAGGSSALYSVISDVIGNVTGYYQNCNPCSFWKGEKSLRAQFDGNFAKKVMVHAGTSFISGFLGVATGVGWIDNESVKTAIKLGSSILSKVAGTVFSEERKNGFVGLAGQLSSAVLGNPFGWLAASANWAYNDEFLPKPRNARVPEHRKKRKARKHRKKTAGRGARNRGGESNQRAKRRPKKKKKRYKRRNKSTQRRSKK